MVSVNLKVLAKFGLCSNCSQKLHGCSLACARKIFATARMPAFLLKCAQLLKISLILLCSYFLYINNKSVMIWLKQKGWNILTFGFSLSSTVQPVTVLEALCVLSDFQNARSSTASISYIGFFFIIVLFLFVFSFLLIFVFSLDLFLLFHFFQESHRMIGIAIRTTCSFKRI